LHYQELLLHSHNHRYFDELNPMRTNPSHILPFFQLF